MSLLGGASQIIGTVATIYGFGGALAVLMQARQMHRRGTSDDVSARFLATYVGGYAVWLLYGLSIESLPIIVVHAVGLCSGSVTLAVALALREGRRAAPGLPAPCPAA